MKLRLSADLKKRVETSADENRRSLNAELVARLEASFAAPGFSLEIMIGIVRTLIDPENDALREALRADPKYIAEALVTVMRHRKATAV